VFRGRFVTGEKLEKYRDYCHVQGAFLGAGVSAIGFSLSSGIGIAGLGGAVFVGFAIVHSYVTDGNFEKIEDAIEDADRGENQ
jgi:hypothetical protein